MCVRSRIRIFISISNPYTYVFLVPSYVISVNIFTITAAIMGRRVNPYIKIFSIKILYLSVVNYLFMT